MSSIGDKLTSLAAGVKDLTDPVAKLAADAYDSITSNGFKPIKQANDADVKRLTEALKKSASSTEMLAKITEGEAKQDSKNKPSGMGNRPGAGSDARSVVAQAGSDARSVVGQASRPQEAPLTRVEAQQTLDKGLPESVIDLTSKMQDTVAPRKEEQQAKDDKFLSNILTGATDGTEAGAPRVNTPPISRQDWHNIFSAKNETKTPSSLPKLEIVSTAFGSGNGETPDTKFGSVEGTIEPGEIATAEEDNSRRLVQKPDGSIFYGEGLTSITRTLAGEIRMQGANDTLKVLNGELLAFSKAGRAFLDKSAGRKTRAGLGNEAFILPSHDGLDITDKAGTVVGKIEADQILSRRMKMQTAQYLDEVDFKKAMERWRRDGNKLEPGKTSLYMRFKSGFALVEPGANQYAVVMFKEGNKFEVHQKLADDVTIVKDADNRYFLNTKETRLELSDEQLDEVLKGLPEDQQKNLRKTLANLEKGVIDAPDGKLLLNKNGRAQFVSVVGTLNVGFGIIPLLNFNIDAHSDELVENRADGSKTKTQLDLINRKYAQEETNATGEVTETKIDLANGLKAKGADWTLENKVFTTKDNFRIDQEGNVTTPGGSVVRINGDINYSNGMTLEGGVVKDRSKPESPQNAPTEKHVEALIRTGLSLAKSLASGGSATFAQIALLQANLSIVSNLVGLFSDMGQLQEATKLFKVWGTMNESLCKARIEVDERIVRSQHNNVAMLSASGSDRFSSISASSGGWISCQLKAA